MGTITIDGRTFIGSNLTIRNGKVIIDGVAQDGALHGIVEVKISGDVQNLTVDAPTTCNGDVKGDLTVTGPTTCRHVGGDVRVTGPLTCGDVAGDVHGSIITRR